jgi:N6-L-threonylcarbamoyladenine synthase
MIILGIESSCDETAVGIVNKEGQVLANVLYSQIDEHAVFGGVVPEVAARAHLEKITPIAIAALAESKLTLEDVDLVAFTRGPGLMGPLLVGASFARGLAMSLGVPCTGIHHLEGHIAAATLSFPDLKPPFLCLTVSGGHTEICAVDEELNFELLGRTRDDAAGEAFDKCGKILGLGYPAGAKIGQLAANANRKFVHFPRARLDKTEVEFSFSGLKTSVLRYTQSQTPEYLQENLKDICASLESAIVDILVEKTLIALRKTKLKTLVVCGGVSANRHLRAELGKLGQKHKVRICVPEVSLCTDNGAMIAGAALNRYRIGKLEYDLSVKPSLSLYKTV